MRVGQKVVLSFNGYWEKGQSILWLNSMSLPSLGSVGIQLDTGKYSGNGVPLSDAYLYASTPDAYSYASTPDVCLYASTGIHLLGVVPSGIHLLGAINFALCIRGTRGKGTLRTYPSFRVPTHPFRVLG